MQQTIEQKHYGDLDVDNSELDVVLIWMEAKDSQVVLVERGNLKKLINTLQTCLEKGRQPRAKKQ